MNAPTRCLLYMLVLVTLLSGCASHSESAAATTASAGNPGRTVCDRGLLSVADAQAVLRDPVVGTRALPGDAQSCYFVGAAPDSGGSQLLVTLRPSGGTAALATFRSGKIDAYAASQPLSGIGDEAVWLPELHEVDARRGDVLCVAQPSGLADTLDRAGESARQRAVGALCAKIFAALAAERDGARGAR